MKCIKVSEPLQMPQHSSLPVDSSCPIEQNALSSFSLVLPLEEVMLNLHKHSSKAYIGGVRKQLHDKEGREMVIHSGHCLTWCRRTGPLTTLSIIVSSCILSKIHSKEADMSSISPSMNWVERRPNGSQGEIQTLQEKHRTLPWTAAISCHQRGCHVR